VTAEAILEKIILFPQVKLRVELGRQMLIHLNANRFGQCVQRRDLIESQFVERAAHQPGFVAITKEVALTKVLQPDQTFVGVVKVNLWDTNSVLGKKVRYCHIVTVFLPLQIVLYQNERLLGRATDPIEFAIRSALLNWRDFYLPDIQAREMLPRSSNKQVSSHKFRCRCRDGCR